jgi:hypothetical protein
VATQRTTKPALKPTPASQWKKASVGTPLEVPSGNTALVRSSGMQVFLTKGLIPNSLLPIVRQAMSGKQVDLKAEDITEDQLEDMMKLFDAIVVHCVIEPTVLPVPADGEVRDQEALYVDDVDFDDKMFIFQWVVGGTRDLEQFRKEQAASVESVRGGAALESAAE